MSLKPGEIIDNKYRIVRLIGEGGMGSVHEGENTRIKRRVAIKVLHGHAAANEAAVTRFEREAQAAGHIGSDHILEVLDVGVLADGDRYMVMEFLDGESLSSRIEKYGRLTPWQFQPLLRQGLVGLHAAHAAGIIHRDLKPDNIFVLNEKAGQKDFIKIIDFGISKFNVLGGDMEMTRTGAVMGTPYYMSPEQAKGSKVVDARSDLYSMGVIAYEALTGRVPFEGDTFNELMFKIALADPAPLRDVVPDVEPAFAAIVERMMARDINARFQTAAELVAALDQWLATHAGGTVPNAGVAVAAVQPRSAGVSTLGEASGQGGPGGTKSTWATSRADVVPKKSLGPVVAAGVAAVVLLIGGAFAALKLTGSKSEGEPSLAASAPLSAATPSVPESVPKVDTAAPEPPPPPAPEAPPASASAAQVTASAPRAVAATASKRVAVSGSSSRKKTETATLPTKPPPATPTAKSKAREFGY